MISNLTVVLLAGGKSTRFWPLSNKLTIKLLGRTFLEHQLEIIRNVGFKEVVVVANQELQQRISGTNIKVVVQKGDGQSAALLSVANNISERPILVINADDVVSNSLFEELSQTIDDKHNILVGLKTDRYFPGGYLVLEGKKVARVVEKPGEGNEPSNYTRLVCDYFVDGSKLLKYLMKKLSYEDALSAMMKDGEVFEMLEYKDTWIPVKYPWHTLALMDFFLSQIQKTSLHKSARVHKSASLVGSVILEKNVRVMEYAKLVGPLYVRAGTIVGNHTMVRSSMIGENTVIGFGSDITRSYIGDNSWFHSNYVGDSVIASDVGLGAGAVLANLRLDEGDIYSVVKGERVNSHRPKLGAIIGEGSRIGVEAQLMPGVKVGRNSVVGPGVILHQDLADNKRVLVKQSHLVSDNVVSNIRSRDRFRQKL